MAPAEDEEDDSERQHAEDDDAAQQERRRKRARAVPVHSLMQSAAGSDDEGAGGAGVGARLPTMTAAQVDALMGPAFVPAYVDTGAGAEDDGARCEVDSLSGIKKHVCGPCGGCGKPLCEEPDEEDLEHEHAAAPQGGGAAASAAAGAGAMEDDEEEGGAGSAGDEEEEVDEGGAGDEEEEVDEGGAGDDEEEEDEEDDTDDDKFHAFNGIVYGPIALRIEGPLANDAAILFTALQKVSFQPILSNLFAIAILLLTLVRALLLAPLYLF